MSSSNTERRVVVTGMGALTPIGNTVRDTWEAALAGVSGIACITHFDASAFTTRIAGEVKGWTAIDHMDRKLANRLDPFSQYALAAANAALKDAGITPETFSASQRDRAGVIVGSGIGGIQTFQEQSHAFFQSGPKRMSPFFIPMMIPDMAAGVISMQHGFRGPNHCVVTACATGNHNINDAYIAIRRDESDLIIAGGSEAAVCELGIGGFAAMKAMSTRNDDPASASRPFDAGRDGFVMGEGAGMLVLEELSHARRRGARIYAEVLGVGSSADAYHMTAPHHDGIGARLAMLRILAAARIAPADVDTINMHGTSTPLGDSAETKAIREVFGGQADKLTPTSTKSMTGHLLGAAGAVEAIFSILSIVNDVVPPTINFETPDPTCDLPYAFNAPVHRPVRIALSNAFGFGGHNTCAAFKKFEE